MTCAYECKKTGVEKKTVHIVVKDGLVQDVYADNGLDINVIIYDLDTDDNEEYDKLTEALAKLSSGVKRVY